MPHPAVAEQPRAVAQVGGAELVAELVEIGHSHGLAAVAVAPAGVFSETREVLVDRKRRGLHGGMQFTYRNPDRSTDPDRILAGARSLVVGAWSYHDGGDAAALPRPSGPRGQVARVARADHYAALRRALGPVADRLRAGGWRAVVVCDDNGLVDRAAAHRAGLGWYGKNTLVLLRGVGSWVVLGSVVTDAPLEAAPVRRQAVHGEGCGRCTACLDSCPTGALVAPGELDARRCLAWILQAPGPIPEALRPAVGDRVYGCDECQEVCPVNKRRSGGTTLPTGIRPPDSVDLLGMLAASDDALLAAHGRWYIPGRDPNHLRRNALVALGNVGDGGDPGTVEALRRWVAAPDPMLAEHARWAARSLGRADLIGDA